MDFKSFSGAGMNGMFYGMNDITIYTIVVQKKCASPSLMKGLHTLNVNVQLLIQNRIFY